MSAAAIINNSFQTTKMEIESDAGFRVEANMVINQSWSLPEICWSSLKVMEWSTLSSMFIDTTAFHKRNQQSKLNIENLLIQEFSKTE